jgi:hypothetical protein
MARNQGWPGLSGPIASIGGLAIGPWKSILESGQRWSQLVHNRPDRGDGDEFGQVLRFPRRPEGLPLRAPPAIRPDERTIEPDGDLAAYEQDRDDVIDYRQRTVMNVIAVAIVTLLVGAGVWIADTIAEIQRDQDCVIQGRSNCAPVELPLTKRQ